MKASELTVEVNASLTVSDETVKRCLRLIEIWQEDNPNKMIVSECTPTPDGKYSCSFSIRETSECKNPYIHNT